MRFAVYLIAAANTAMLVTAFAAKYVQHHQASMMTGRSGDIADWMILGCQVTWSIGTVLIVVMRHRGIRTPPLIGAWWAIAGVPVILFTLGLFLFLLPAFL